jgi:medium-chain acyl-[acyl-carrier-protein] hydrolase
MDFPETIEVIAVQLPARETRFRENPVRAMQPLVEGMVIDVRAFVDKPFAIFGHSVGALVAFELARLLMRGGDPPSMLIASAHTAPDVPYKGRRFSEMPDDRLVDELRRINPGASAALDNHELAQQMLPVVRADFALNEGYSFTEGALSCDVAVLGGREDPDVPPDALLAWQRHTSALLSVHLFPGGHFFLHQEPARVQRALVAQLGCLER